MKVTIIVVLSLLSATVCFGILESSGVVENGAVQLGGAFAGFIVAVWLLNRVWGNDAKPDSEGEEEPTYEEIVKLLDLREASPRILPQFAPLTDYYLARRLEDQNKLVMHYGATSKDGIKWEGSLTHPMSAKWLKVPPGKTGSHRVQLKSEYEVNVDLGELAVGELTPVINQVVYKNAFTKPDQEWLETHIDESTGRLTMIVLVSQDMEVSDARGGKSIGRIQRELEPGTQPAVIQKGSVIYWSMKNPEKGARYGVEWNWSHRTASQPTP